MLSGLLRLSGALLRSRGKGSGIRAQTKFIAMHDPRQHKQDQRWMDSHLMKRGYPFYKPKKIGHMYECVDSSYDRQEMVSLKVMIEYDWKDRGEVERYSKLKSVLKKVLPGAEIAPGHPPADVIEKEASCAVAQAVRAAVDVKYPALVEGEGEGAKDRGFYETPTGRERRGV